MGFDAGLTSPLPSGKANVGRGWLGPGSHAGLDIAIPEGTEILACRGGTVSHASATPQGDLGIFAVVRHDNGLLTRYLHMSRLDVAVGDAVDRGQQLGLSGTTGLSTGPHLHLDIKVADDATLEAIRAVAGEPSSGFESNVTGFGQGVPAEPWVPVDSYSENTKTNAQQQGIPLYDEIPHALVDGLNLDDLTSTAKAALPAVALILIARYLL
jgi:murein DD-endopeptidase MepM/ murein hydrolase activator NlpD